MNKVTVFSSGFLIGALLVLPSCDLFKGPEETKEVPTARAPEVSKEVTPSAPAKKTEATTSKGEVLLTLYDEKIPKITTEDFQSYKKELLEAQPNYASIIEFMPGANKQIFDSLKNEIIVEEDIKKNKIDQTQAYKDDLDKIMKYARRSLNVKYFQDKHPVTITDAEIKAYYDENKSSIPQLVASQGGIEAKMVLFTTKEAADAFLAKTKDPKTNFDALAKEENLTVKDLGEVSSQSYDVEGPVRTYLVDLKTFPAVDLVTINDKSFAVIKALKKTEPTYVPFEQVKSGIENLLKQQKSTEILTKEIEKLEKEYKAVVNDQYFDRETKAQEEKAKKVAESMQKDQEPKTMAPAPMKAA